MWSQSVCLADAQKTHIYFSLPHDTLLSPVFVCESQGPRRQNLLVRRRRRPALFARPSATLSRGAETFPLLHRYGILVTANLYFCLWHHFDPATLSRLERERTLIPGRRRRATAVDTNAVLARGLAAL